MATETAKKLDGKIALVVGGSSGIGKATAIAFAEAGAKVVVASRGEEDGRKTVELIEQAGSEGLFVQTDVSIDSDVKQLIEKTVEKFERIDIAFNNAGIEGKLAPVADIDESDFDAVIAVNLKGIYLGMKYQISAMMKTGGGVIVNTASTGGIVGVPNFSPYCASKHGVIGLTKVAALELAESDIRINAIAPGAVRTGMMEKELEETLLKTIPAKRISAPEEIANTVLWLCSEESSYITGQTIVIDGGMTIQ